MGSELTSYSKISSSALYLILVNSSPFLAHVLRLWPLYLEHIRLDDEAAELKGYLVPCLDFLEKTLCPEVGQVEGQDPVPRRIINKIEILELYKEK